MGVITCVNKYYGDPLLSHLSPVRMTTPTAFPCTSVVPKYPMFSASLELSVLAVGDLLSGAHSPVRDELSTIAELHQIKRRSAGILSPDLRRQVW